MQIQFQMDPLLLYCIFINGAEIVACCFLFGLFLSNARKGDVGKGVQGKLSVFLGVGFLLWGIGRAFYMQYDYVFPSEIWFSTASLLQIIGGVTVALVMYLALNPAFRESRRVFLIPFLLLIGSIYAPSLVFSGLFSNVPLLLTGNLIMATCTSLICYYFARAIQKKGAHVSRQIFAIALGWIVLMFGGASTSNNVLLLFPGSELLVKAVGHTLVVAGSGAWSAGFWTLPVLKELEWRASLKHLYLIMKSGICVYDQSFPGDGAADSNLVAGGITGIATLIQEMTASKGELEVIRQERVKILLSPGEYTTGVLVAAEDLRVLHRKLGVFVAECEGFFKYELPSWHGNVELFAPARVICERHFGKGLSQKGEKNATIT